MLESKFTARLLKTLRAILPQAVIFKHNDQFTGRIPDFSVTLDRRTTWFEVKITPNVPTSLQWLTMRRLKRAYLLTYDDAWELGALQQATGATWLDVNDDSLARVSFGEIVQRVIALSKEK